MSIIYQATGKGVRVRVEYSEDRPGFRVYRGRGYPMRLFDLRRDAEQFAAEQFAKISKAGRIKQ